MTWCRGGLDTSGSVCFKVELSRTWEVVREEDVSAAQGEASPEAWLPRSDGDRRWAEDDQPAPRQGAQAAHDGALHEAEPAAEAVARRATPPGLRILAPS